MSWDSATAVLYSAAPTLGQVDALSRFVREHADELAHCYAPKYAAKRPALARFMSRLFELLECGAAPAGEAAPRLAEVVEQTAGLLERDDFFEGLFHHALFEGDAALLELVYSSLFTVISFSGRLTMLWFQKKLEAERAGAPLGERSRAAAALCTIASVQFLDVRQDWASASASAELLLSLNESISASSDTLLKLVWTLALYFMAQQYYAVAGSGSTTTNGELGARGGSGSSRHPKNTGGVPAASADPEGDDGKLDVEPLMRELQLKTGVHWSQVLKDQLQVSLPGLEALLSALVVLREEYVRPLILRDIQFSQTVAEVVGCLFVVSKPTESLCAALATAIEPHPELQRVPWLPAAQLALIKAKFPASLGSLVSVAQTLDLRARRDFLAEMGTYVCAVDAAALDIGAAGQDPEDWVLGCDVRSTQDILVIPPRPTDNQGRLDVSENTRGTLLAFDGTECLVMWYFSYSGWALLGRILEDADLREGDAWRPATVEILKLLSITMDVGALNAVSSALSRGDIVDLVAARLQSWIHASAYAHCELAFNLLANFAAIEPARVWALLGSLTWTAAQPVLDGLRRLLRAAWPTFDARLPLHTRVLRLTLELFRSQYLLSSDVSMLEVFELFLPQSAELRDDFLGASPLRETITAPLLANLHDPAVLAFCKYCMDLDSGRIPTAPLSPDTAPQVSAEGETSGVLGSRRLAAATAANDSRATPQLLEYEPTETSSSQWSKAKAAALGSSGAAPYSSALSLATSAGTSSSVGAASVRAGSSHTATPATSVESLAEPPYLAMQLFAKSSELTRLLLTESHLQAAIIALWTSLIERPDAPSLLAFLEKGQADLIKTKLNAIAADGLESNETLACLARFLGTRRQESMLDLLAGSLLPKLEARLPSIGDAESQAAVINALKLVSGPLQPSTLAVLQKIVAGSHPSRASGSASGGDPAASAAGAAESRAKGSAETAREGGASPAIDTAAIKARKAAIEVLTQQLRRDAEPLKAFIPQIEQLTPELTSIQGVRPSLHSKLYHNLRSKWPGILGTEDTFATFEPNLKALDAQLGADAIWETSYRPEVIEAIHNREQIRAQADVVEAWCELMVAVVRTASSHTNPAMLATWVLQLLEANSNTLPVSLQRAEEDRTQAALVILQDPRCERTVGLLGVIYHQLMGLTMSPGAGLPVLRPRLKASMQMAVLVLSSLGEDAAQQDVKLAPILLGLLDVVAIKQLQIFGTMEDTLPLHLLILRRSLRLLEVSGRRPQELVQSMVESGSDVTILEDYANTPVSNPWRGELRLTYIQEWLRSRIMTDTFVRNGLMNVLIDAPLSRLVQGGGIVPSAEPELHSLWRRGILPTVAHLLRELESRISEETWLFIENYARQIATCLEQWKTGLISEALVEETWVLCIILRSASHARIERVGVRFDEEELKKTIEVLLSHQNYLASRTQPNVEAQSVVKELESFHQWLC